MHGVTSILRIEPFYVLLLSGPVFFPGRLIPLQFHISLLVVALLLVIVRRVHASLSSQDVDCSPLIWPSIVLMVSCLIGVSVSPIPTTSLVVAGYLIYSIVAHIAVYHWYPFQTHPLRFILSAAGAVALFSLLAPFLVLWKPEFRLFDLPLYEWLSKGGLAAYNQTGETIHANVLAGILGPFILLLLPFAIWTVAELSTSSIVSKDVSRFKNVVNLVLLCIVIIYWLSLLILTQSRGAYLGLGSGLCVMLVLFQPRLLRFAVAVGGAVLLSLVIVAIVRPSLFLGMESTLGGGEFRWDIWSNAAYAISDTPITGIGPGMYTAVVPQLYPFAYVDGSLADHAHNIFLQVGLDTGIPGMVSFVTILILCSVMLGTLLQVRSYSSRWFLSVGAASGLCGLLTHGLLDAVVWGTKISFVPWMLFTAISLLYRQMAYNDSSIN